MARLHPRHPATARTAPRAASRPASGFTLLELLMATAFIALVAMVGVSYVARGVQQTDTTKDRLFAYQKAVSILNELRGYVEGAEGEVAADVEKFDDGSTHSPVLTIARLPNDPDRPVAPDHVISGNAADNGVWKWSRQISVRPVGEAPTRDRRYCTVRVFRRKWTEPEPGVLMAQVSGIVQSMSDVYPSVQVYDLYVLQINNIPGWWEESDSLSTYMEGALAELRGALPGAEFRVHYIRKSGFGRDEEYAPYANEVRTTLDPTEWAYWYPGRIPDDETLEREDERYYGPLAMRGRLNLDGATQPAFVHDYALPEPFVDTDGDMICDPDEDYTDTNGNEIWDQNCAVPYAMADQQNHAMRWPQEKARFDARVAVGLDDADEPTWRLLLDDMIANPSKYRNAIVLNMHGELLPMPPVRNYSDAAKIPELRPGWRVVTHPEMLRPRRTKGSDTASDVPRWRVYAYKTEFQNTEEWTTLPEPYADVNANGAWDTGEAFTDWNGNGVHDAGIPTTVVLPGADFSKAPNAATAPSIVIKRLTGGIRPTGTGTPTDYVDWANAPVLPERFTDANGNGIREVTETWFDLNGNGTRDPFDPWVELDGNGVYSATTEALQDTDADGLRDLDRPEETYTDSNANLKWDAGEPYWDRDGNGVWTAPTNPQGNYVAWNPNWYGNDTKTTDHIAKYGEPWLDQDGDKKFDAAEAFVDGNGNGVWDAGFKKGDMFCKVAYDAAARQTVVTLYGTPLQCPYHNVSKRGLHADWYLYDLEYVPCPTPGTATDTNPWTRDLFEPGTFPKNTARWTIEVPLASLRAAYETSPGALDGDAADRILVAETRFGTDLTTGVKWPTWNQPQNRSVAYSYFYANASSVPFSERYQFQGDPRHCPYADLAMQGTTGLANGYNAFWDSLKTDGDERDRWLAFDPLRLYARWMDKCAQDVPRYMQWLRTAMTDTEAVFASMTGFTGYYLSVGGDVGYDNQNSTFGVPCNGIPYGLTDPVEENTFMDVGGFAPTGCTKHVRSCNGDNKPIRETGYWWSKPWLGELFQDGAYAGQWKPWGNLRAALGTTALTYKLIKRESITTEQQPQGTKMKDARGLLGPEGCTGLFLCGVKDRTFHHKEGAIAGTLSGEGATIGTDYGFAMPTQLSIKHPFGLDWSGDGGEPPEFLWTTDFPHWTATLAHDYAAKAPAAKEKGCALVRLTDAGATKMGRFLVTSLSPETETGPAFLMKLQLVTILHSYMLEGLTGTAGRLPQLPRPEIKAPLAHDRFEKPGSITVRWDVKWQRWDGKPYHATYPTTFTENVSDLVYVLMYSEDNGTTWRNARDRSRATPGELPLLNGVAHPGRTLTDTNATGEETFVLATPAAQFPEGTYILRLDVHRASRGMHYAQHQTRLYVER